MENLDGYEIAPVELPQVRILHLEPGDVLLISAPHMLTDADVAAIGQRVKAKFPGHDVAVLDNGLTLDILRKVGEK
jgi:hypothetical protein